MLHAGRAREGFFLPHLIREDRSINLHPQFGGCIRVKVCFRGLYFVCTTRLSPKKTLLLKSPAFLDLWREPVWKQLLKNLFSVTFTYRELTRVLLRTTWPSHTKGKRESILRQEWDEVHLWVWKTQHNNYGSPGAISSKPPSPARSSHLCLPSTGFWATHNHSQSERNFW